METHHVDARFQLVTMRCGWTVKGCETASLSLSAEHIAALRFAVEQVARIFPYEGSWVQQECGVHSLVVRVDHVGGKICEIEPRPCGMGVCAAVLPTTTGAELLQAKAAAWNNLQIATVVSPERSLGSDDIDAGFELLDASEANQYAGLLLVRSLPSEIDFHRFTSRSIAPIQYEMSKAYGIDMGLWSEVEVEEVRRLMHEDKTFVIKSDGARSEQVYIWRPGNLESNFLERIRRLQPRYLQAYIPHAKSPFAHTQGAQGNVPWATLYRTFFFFDVSTCCWIHGGTCWVATPAPPVHGVPEMIMGPVRII